MHEILTYVGQAKESFTSKTENRGVIAVNVVKRPNLGGGVFSCY
jgi:hypothetical protein